MVSIEELGLVISIISGTVIPIIFFLMLRHLKGTDSTSNKATMATFNIGSMTKEVNEIKETIDEQQKHFDKKLDTLTIMIERKDDMWRTESLKREEKWKTDVSKIWDRLETIYTDVKLHDYRLSKLDGTEK